MLRRPPLPLCGVLLATLVVLGPVVLGDYVDDDLDLVQASPAFFGLERIWDAVRTPFWGSELPYWRPLASAVLCIGHAIGGGHPWAIHAIALLAHLAATAVAFALLVRTGASARVAALGASVFALHPCQVEGVAWASAIGDPLACLFALLALERWSAWRENGSARLPMAAWGCTACALFAKESGVVALGWIAAFEIARRSLVREPSRRWLDAFGLAVVVLAWFGLRVAVFGDLRAGFDRGSIGVATTTGEAVCIGFELLLGFVRVLFGWHGATPYREIGFGALDAFVATASVLAFVAARQRARATATFAALGMLFALLPAVLAPDRLGPWPLVDRYLATPVFALALLVAATNSVRTWLLALLAAVCALGSAIAVPKWRTQEAVVQRALADAPQHPEPWFVAANLDRLRAETGAADSQQLVARCRSAAARYRHALLLLQTDGLYAGRHLRSLLGLNAALGLAWARSTGGLATPQEVAKDLERLAREHAQSAQVWLMLGVARVQGGDARGAEQAWREALRVDATSYQAAFNLGRLYAQLGDRDAARAMLRQSLQVNPGNAAAAELLRQLGG